ncbi:MAG: mandelate racemase/muconate lactonizing enzyme family protein [Alphaproteobacteria bacterium]|nr:mandelate racemase/muconate lactonizing enzyme family protein [Alphaproteobacteria bacterium]
MGGGIAITTIDAIDVRVSPKTVWSFVRIADSDGHVGWGEGSMPGVGAQAAFSPVLASFARSLTGTRIAQPIDLSPRLGERPGDLAWAAAISAADQALWDIAGQRAGRPIAELLGPPRREAVPLYANINRRTVDRTPAGFAASARAPLAHGYAAFKIAPFDGVSPNNADTADGRRLIAAGLERAGAVRCAIGPGARLMIDCHWRLTEAAALDVIAQVRSSGIGLYWLECALPEEPANHAAMRRVRAKANEAGILTAGCETMTARAGFAPYVEGGLYDVIMPDVKYAGGLLELLRIGEEARARGVATAAHNPTGPVCHAHSLHLSAVLDRMPFLEHQYDESPLFLGFVAGPPADFTAALVQRSRAPGLGLTLDDTVVARHRDTASM